MNAKLSGWPCLSTTDEKVKDIVSVKLVLQTSAQDQLPI